MTLRVRWMCSGVVWLQSQASAFEYYSILLVITKQLIVVIGKVE